MSSAVNGTKNSIISHRSVDLPRPLKVICVGAGVSGILTAIKLLERLPGIDLTIYEKNEEVGGTWFENRYPGCACDVPAHCYQLSFESNPTWSQFYATAPEILEYWKKVTEKYGVRTYMKMAHRVLEARWDEASARWGVTVEELATGKTIRDDGDVLVLGIGVLNHWQWPNISGLHTFQGSLMHSAAWDDNFKPEGKRVAVIGAGSSGIQIVPSLQPQVERLDHYVRGKTWISTPFAAQEVAKRTAGTASNFKFTEDEIEAWKEDPDLYYSYRRDLESELQSGFAVTMRGSMASRGATELFTMLMKGRLAKTPEIAEYLVPAFPPGCKRLTPGPGYLEALTQDNVDVIVSPIRQVTETGILTEDGVHREIDALVCATGFDTTHLNRFPVLGRDGANLSEKWTQRADTYLSMTTHGFPNLFMLLGPNSGLGHGNLLMVLERMASYIAKAVEKIQFENIKTMAPLPRAVQAFTNFCDEYFMDTVFGEECASWYKTGGKNGRVTALWPGSSLHAVKALENPRWEDFEYTYVDQNHFGWFGDGWSERDRKELDRAYYLRSSMLHHPLECK